MRLPQSTMSFPTLRFSKSGAEIKSSLSTLISSLEKDIDESKAKIADLCKKREIDPKEILDAKDEETVARTSVMYSTAIEVGARGIRANGILQELQKDIDSIQSESDKMTHYFREKGNYSAVSNNLKDDQRFDLTYPELQLLGFK